MRKRQIKELQFAKKYENLGSVKDISELNTFPDYVLDGSTVVFGDLEIDGDVHLGSGGSGSGSGFTAVGKESFVGKHSTTDIFEISTPTLTAPPNIVIAVESDTPEFITESKLVNINTNNFTVAVTHGLNYINNLFTVDPFSGTYPSIKNVNGFPAIAFTGQSTTTLRYVRSTDAKGVSWSSEISVDPSALNAGIHSSLEVVNENPAIAYYDASSSTLKYVRSVDSNGDVWGLPVSISVGLSNTAESRIILFIVNGFPAIVYNNPGAQLVAFVRALDINGDSWGSGVSVDGTSGPIGDYLSASVVDGNPALCYKKIFASRLVYVRALDVDGASWGLPVLIDSVSPETNGDYNSMCVVNGNPAIVTSGAISGLYYIRSDDSDGTSWTNTVKIIDGICTYNCMIVIDDKPTVVFINTNTRNLTMVTAVDVNGDAWGVPYEFNYLKFGEFLYTSINNINDHLAISSYDNFGNKANYFYFDSIDYKLHWQAT